jgi:hypothetical protein
MHAVHSGEEIKSQYSQADTRLTIIRITQIKTFRLKYIFLAGKIVRTARGMVMKLSQRYPYREIYEHCLAG